MHLLLDERVLAEFQRIATTKLRVDAAMLAEAEIFFRRFAHVMPAASEPAVGIADPDDAWIVATAVASDAELFITGDKALLALGSVEGLPIVDPRAAYLRLRGLG